MQLNQQTGKNSRFFFEQDWYKQLAWQCSLLAWLFSNSQYKAFYSFIVNSGCLNITFTQEACGSQASDAGISFEIV